jgi:plasmid stabilization system protein ParE
MVQWLPAAEQDAAEIVDYYDGQRPGLGAVFLLALYGTEGSVDAIPRGAPVVVQPDVRRAIVGDGFNAYGFYYRESAGAVLVVAILHMARDPKWIHRTLAKR